MGSGGTAALFLASLLDGGGQLHTLDTLYQGERAPGTHLVGSWVGLRASLDTME
jgi:hypothetical protein